MKTQSSLDTLMLLLLLFFSSASSLLSTPDRPTDLRNTALLHYGKCSPRPYPTEDFSRFSF